MFKNWIVDRSTAHDCTAHINWTISIVKGIWPQGFYYLKQGQTRISANSCCDNYSSLKVKYVYGNFQIVFAIILLLCSKCRDNHYSVFLLGRPFWIFFFFKKKFFFASSQWKLVNIYRIARIFQNFDDYLGFQPQTAPA